MFKKVIGIIPKTKRNEHDEGKGFEKYRVI
jgi:hypothetical protein